jgi:hypothetical protein
MIFVQYDYADFQKFMSSILFSDYNLPQVFALQGLRGRIQPGNRAKKIPDVSKYQL